MEYEYHIEAVREDTIFNGQEPTKEKALRKVRELEKQNYYAIKLVLIEKTINSWKKKSKI